MFLFNVPILHINVYIILVDFYPFAGLDEDAGDADLENERNNVEELEDGKSHAPAHCIHKCETNDFRIIKFCRNDNYVPKLHAEEEAEGKRKLGNPPNL